MIESV